MFAYKPHRTVFTHLLIFSQCFILVGDLRQLRLYHTTNISVSTSIITGLLNEHSWSVQEGPKSPPTTEETEVIWCVQVTINDYSWHSGSFCCILHSGLLGLWKLKKGQEKNKQVGQVCKFYPSSGLFLRIHCKGGWEDNVGQAEIHNPCGSLKQPLLWLWIW